MLYMQMEIWVFQSNQIKPMSPQTFSKTFCHSLLSYTCEKRVIENMDYENTQITKIWYWPEIL